MPKLSLKFYERGILATYVAMIMMTCDIIFAIDE